MSESLKIQPPSNATVKTDAKRKTLVVRAGSLESIFVDGDLRYVTLDGEEIVRRVYQAVRDRNWETIQPTIHNEKIKTSESSFQISYDAECKRENIHFKWRTQITGTSAGTIRFNFEGEALSNFLKNRIGICVHHPIAQLAGTPCTITKRDGSILETFFPELISPHQPFQDLGKISYQTRSGDRVALSFEGEAFETEDQRNWMDGSYKTYSTPLSNPFPVEIKKGERVRHTFIIQSETKKPVSQMRDSRSESIEISLGEAKPFQLTKIGFEISPCPEWTKTDLDRLKQVQPSHLRVELNLIKEEAIKRLHDAVEMSSRLNSPLEIALHLSDQADAEIEHLVKRLAENYSSTSICRWLVFHRSEKVTSSKWVDLCNTKLSPLFKESLFAIGTNAYFAELNRSRPPRGAARIVNFSVNAQVHACDPLSMAETLEAIPFLVKSARDFSGEAQISISPITLKPRFNPNATAEKILSENDLPDSVDPRQASLFAAAWTAGVLKQLFENGIEQATFYKLGGMEGILQPEKLVSHPKFPIPSGTVFPVYHVFTDIAEFRSGSIISTVSTNHLKVDALTLRKGTKQRLILFNLTDENQNVIVKDQQGFLKLRMLEASNLSVALQKPEDFRQSAWKTLKSERGILSLEVPPHAILCLDSEVQQ